MLMPMADLGICPGNCSGKGVCLSGTCQCEVQYSGWSCSDRNLGYFVTFGVFFYVICLGAILQLALCVWSDFHRSKSGRVFPAFKLSIQKLIYLIVICATGSRAVYFTVGLVGISKESYQQNLFSTFYPFVLSGMFLIICVWAESFHLSGLKLDRPRFLTKSFVGFIVLNTIVYTMLIGQCIGNHTLNEKVTVKMNEVINGCFAVLMLLSLVFFLIYGVEIFCKVEGAFKPQPILKSHININFNQLFFSRFGLIVQSGFLLAVTVFLMSEVLSEMWKEKLPIGERNAFAVGYHIAELACVLWFPCCLWNVKKPGELWILNPQKILDLGRIKEEEPIVRASPSPSNYNTFSSASEDESIDESDNEDREPESDETKECWICYDNEKEEELIQPCDCKGGTKYVHHACLKKWLIERPDNNEEENSHITCNVCKAQYKVERDNSIIWLPNGLQVKAWGSTVFVIVTMVTLPVGLILLWNKIPYEPLKVGLAVGLIFAQFMFLRLLGFNFMKAYKITKKNALKILGRHERKRVRSGSSDSATQPNDNASISSVSIAVET